MLLLLMMLMLVILGDTFSSTVGGSSSSFYIKIPKQLRQPKFPIQTFEFDLDLDLGLASFSPYSVPFQKSKHEAEHSPRIPKVRRPVRKVVSYQARNEVRWGENWLLPFQEYESEDGTRRARVVSSESANSIAVLPRYDSLDDVKGEKRMLIWTVRIGW